jgi:hypothetical protein
MMHLEKLLATCAALEDQERGLVKLAIEDSQ